MQKHRAGPTGFKRPQKKKEKKKMSDDFFKKRKRKIQVHVERKIVSILLFVQQK